MKKTCFISITACIVLSGCTTWNHGLEPIKPKYTAYSWNEKVDTLTPRFEWSQYEHALGKQEFRYQLQVLDGNVIRLFKDGIHDNYYVVDEPLLPNKEYQWAVRAAWTINGKTEGEDWNSKKYFYISPVLFGWGAKNYKINTPVALAYSGDVPKPGVVAEQPKIASQQELAPVPANTVSGTPTTIGETTSQKLRGLQALRKDGIITEDEFQKKKQQLLEKL